MTTPEESEPYGYRMLERFEVTERPLVFATTEELCQYRARHEAWVQENLRRADLGLESLPLPAELAAK